MSHECFGARHHTNDTARRTRVRNYVQACMLARAVGAPTLSSRADVRLSFFGSDYCGFRQFGVITIVGVLLKHQFFLRTNGRFVRVRVLRCIRSRKLGFIHGQVYRPGTSTAPAALVAE